MLPLFVNTKILQYPTTGVQRYLFELLSELGDRLQLMQPVPRREGMLGHLWEQTELLSKTSSGVLWSPSNTGPVFHRRHVLTIHDVTPLDHPEWMGNHFARWYRFLTPKLAGTVKHILTDSEYSKQRILHHTQVIPDKVTVIPCGVGRSFHPRGKELIQTQLSALNLPSEHYILSLGSLEPRKNTARLLEAWRSIQNQVDPKLWLVVVGAKGRQSVFSDLHLGDTPARVHYTDHLPSPLLPVIYSGAVAFVYPSLYEGFGLPPLEAMASGVPVITSNTTSIPEVVGNAAITVNPLNTGEIAQAMLKVLENEGLRCHLSSAGLMRSQRFSWRDAANRTLAILEQVAHE
jgi:glycosyltransferase involved in cell wall biosynthesis